MTLAPTKFEVPRLPSGWVPRDRPIAQLSQGVERPVTLISAAAGSGKTVLLAGWARHRNPPGPVAWLSLDEDDSDPARLWAYLIEAVCRTGAVPESGELRKIVPTAPPSGSFLAKVVQGLLRLTAPVMLVLDDLHLVPSPEALGPVAFLLRHPVPRLRIIIATRADPDLPLHRLRLEGRLTEIRATDLAFTIGHTSAVLAAHGVTLSPADLHALWTRTEGWPAGVRLSAISLVGRADPGRFIADLANNDRAIADYLVEEVLNQQPPVTRDFLIRTSIAERLTADLADTLTGRADGAEQLATLERGNAFVARVNDGGASYRYHRLFADILRERLRREAPGEIAPLHLRAARWHAGHGELIDAVRHAIAADDFRYAIALLADKNFAWSVRPDVHMVGRLLERLPDELIEDLPESAVVLGFRAALRGDVNQVPGLARWADKQASRLPTARRLSLRLSIYLLMVSYYRLRGDLPGKERAAAALALNIGEVRTAGVPVDSAIAAFALSSLGCSQVWLGRWEQARSALVKGIAEARTSGVDTIEINCLGHLALISLDDGDPTRAGELAGEAYELIERNGRASHRHAIAARLVLGLIRLARGELDAADQMLPAVGEEFLLQPGGYWTVAIADTRARLLALRGRPDAALRVLDAAVEGSRWMPTRGHDAELRAMRADLLTASGRARKALQLLAEPGGDGTPQLPVETVALARALVATGRARAAVTALRSLSLDDSDRSLRLQVRALLVEALAAQALGDSGDAASSLAQAVALAAPPQLVAPFMEPEVARLLHAYPRILTPYPELSRVLAPSLAPATTGQDQTSQAAARLTDRERAVLAYLPTLMTVDEIGETLHISTNTVKTHVRHIYRKLGISSRRDAMRRAWELGLL